jgi:hypothetical protein
MLNDLPPITIYEPFDLQHALINENDEPYPIHADQYIPLARALTEGLIQPQTDVLLVRHHGRDLAFVTLHLVYYHVAQGTLDGEAWMLSFCAACNGGMLFSPVIEGRGELHFVMGGMYNAMLILRDLETRSYWNHITGECLHGVLKGTRLRTFDFARHLRAADALENAPNAQLIYAETYQSVEPRIQAAIARWDMYRSAAEHPYIERFNSTMRQEDTRLPRLDMGLGVRTLATRRYYPLSQVYQHDNALIDSFDGRRLLIYVDPDSGNPSALYTTATSTTWRGDELQLDNGERIRGSMTFDYNGNRYTPERPMQLFMRWYGFSFIFPGCEIYGRP